MRVLINYPIVHSVPRDNRGGYAHLRSNIEVYNSLGYSCIIFCKLDLTKIVDVQDNNVFLNIVPYGHEASSSGIVNNKKEWLFFFLLKYILKKSIAVLLNFFVGLIILFYDVNIIHERMNRRFAIANFINYFNVKLVYEKNDEFKVKITNKALLLTTQEDTTKHENVMRYDWPTLSTGRFCEQDYYRRLMRIEQLDRIFVCLFGVGGNPDVFEVTNFITQHPWLASKSEIILTIAGGTGDENVLTCNGVTVNFVKNKHPWQLNDFDVGLVFYSEKEYPDSRIRLGSPTKIYNYIDSNLVFISNREYYSEKFLLNIDRVVLSELSAQKAALVAENLADLRCAASTDRYAAVLALHLKNL